MDRRDEWEGLRHVHLRPASQRPATVARGLAFFDFPGLDLGPYAEVLPDGTRLELISDPLGEMYGNAVM